MKIISGLVQGSPQWHEHRRNKWNASDAPACLGESPHASRAQLLHRMATGIAPEVDAGTQRRFDAGHAVEVLLRKVAENIVGEPLHPFVAVADFDERYSASFDGCTFVGDITQESKLLNERLRAAFADMETIAPEHRERSAGQCLPIDYRIQCEQQLRVAGAERCLFMTGELRDDGTLGDTLSCWYYPDDALWKRIRAGWEQFDADLAAYLPAEPVERVTAAPIESLPAVSVRMEGALAVHSNLDLFAAKLREFVAGIPQRPSTEMEFATCDAACKALKRAEEALDAAEANALGQVQSVEQVTRTIADLRAIARTARLASEKLVKTRKEQIRIEEVQRGKDALAAHIAELSRQIGKPYMPTVPADFAAAISGKKTIDSLRAAVDQALANAKITANEISGRIQINLAALRELASEHAFLFADTQQLVLKDADACRAIIISRIAEHKETVRKETEAAAERERAKIRAEEEAKARAVAAREQQEREAAERQQREEAAARELAAAKANPAGAELSPAAQAMNEQEGAQRFAAHHRGLPPAAPVSAPPAAVSPAVVPIRPTAAPAIAPTLTLTAINARLGHLKVSAEDLRALGIVPAGRDRAALLFHEAQFGDICDALIRHLQSVQLQRAA